MQTHVTLSSQGADWMSSKKVTLKKHWEIADLHQGSSLHPYGMLEMIKNP